MQNGQPTQNKRRPNPPASYGVRPQRWTPNAARPGTKGSHDAQRNYERYLALAQSQAQSGDVIGAENYYQHAEHYFRTMSAQREAT